MHIENGAVACFNKSPQELELDVKACISSFIKISKDRGIKEDEIEKTLVRMIADRFANYDKIYSTSFFSDDEDADKKIDDFADFIAEQIKKNKKDN